MGRPRCPVSRTAGVDDATWAVLEPVAALQRRAGVGGAASGASRAAATVGGPGQASGVADVAPAVLLALTAAVRAHHVLRFDYATGDEAATAPPGTAGPSSGRTPVQGLTPLRRAEPHHLIARGGRWYLLAWDLDRGDWRTYRADRLTPRLPTGPRFTPRPVPGGDVATFVDSVFRGSTTGSGTWPCTGTVELALAATEVTPFAHDGIVEALGPERCRLTLGAWSWVGIAAAVARYDTDVLTASPPALAHAFQTLSRRFAAAASSADG